MAFGFGGVRSSLPQGYMFSSSAFSFSSLKSLIHLGVCDLRDESNFVFQLAAQLSQHQLLKNSSPLSCDAILIIYSVVIWMICYNRMKYQHCTNKWGLISGLLGTFIHLCSKHVLST